MLNSYDHTHLRHLPPIFSKVSQRGSESTHSPFALTYCLSVHVETIETHFPLTAF